MLKLSVVLLLTVCSASGCYTGDDEATETLVKAGYKSVTITGTNVWMCGHGDKPFGADFSATNPAGLRVEGVVCCGVLKGCTVRF